MYSCTYRADEWSSITRAGRARSRKAFLEEFLVCLDDAKLKPIARAGVMEAVKKNGNALQYASAELQDDWEIVMVAVKQNGNALQYASAELKGDREIVMEAVAQDPKALQYASDELTNGGFEDHVNDMMNNRFNVPPETFISTILFGAKASPAAPIDGTSSLASSRPRLGDEQCCFLSLLQPSTVLPGPLSTQIKQLIWEFAGVRSGSKWQVIEDAKRNLSL